MRAVRDPRRGLGVFLYAPVGLAFAVGGVLREMTPCRVYVLARSGAASDGSYQLIYEHG